MPTVVKKVKENTERKVRKDTPAVAGLVGVSVSDGYGKVFNSPLNSSLISQYVRVYQSNQRQGNAHTKTRGDVAGSGKKPWKQKGTGRSRVGSIRTPVWRHGGVSHGPVTKDWSLNFPKKMRFSVFRTALSNKIQNSQAFYIDKVELKEGRTKEVLSTLENWNLKGSVLIITDIRNPNLLKGSSNLRNVEVVNFDNLNTYQIVSNANVVFEKKALDKIKEKYAADK